MNHCVYRIANVADNKHYYGTRSCKILPSVEIKNDTISYKGEIAQYKMKVKPQGII